jgi:hypothetical protein
VVGGAITDAASNVIAPSTLSFKTGDTINPTITATSPTKGATEIARGKTVRITFSETVKGVSTLTLRLKDMKTGNRVIVKVRYDGATRTATIDPLSRLAGSRWYRVKIRHGIEDVAGHNLAEQSFTFKTRA